MNHNYHILYTQYILGIIDGRVTNYSKQEMNDARRFVTLGGVTHDCR